jgi:hypothetical protein
VSGDTVTLMWETSDANSPAYYVIEAGSAPGLADLARFSTGTALQSVSVPDVPPGVYHVRVRAATGAGAGPASNEVVVQVTPRP